MLTNQNFERLIFCTAGLCSMAAILAVVIDRCSHLVAGWFALAGGVPWLAIERTFGHRAMAEAFGMLGIVGSGPLFIVAALLYAFWGRTKKSAFASVVSLVGMAAGFTFWMTLVVLLAAG